MHMCFCFFLKFLDLMQPSIGILNSPSSRVVKDSTSSQRRNLRFINFGIGESLSISFSIKRIIMLQYLKHGESWMNMCFTVLLFIYFKVNLDPENKSAWQISTHGPVFFFFFFFFGCLFVFCFCFCFFLWW